MQEHQRGQEPTTTERADEPLSTGHLAAARPAPPAQHQPADPATRTTDTPDRMDATGSHGSADAPDGPGATGTMDTPGGMTGPVAGTTAGPGGDALLPAAEADEFGRRWETVQAGFLDAPRQSVENADELVADVMQRLAEGFASERERLEHQWGGGQDVSTEDLRLTLQRYRSFFHRLLSA